MEAGVHDDPRDQEARCPGEEALLGQLPGAPILCLVNALNYGGECTDQGEAEAAVEVLLTLTKLSRLLRITLSHKHKEPGS